jgi:glycosyltransferase involved in cell wall biosynthesis
VKFSVLLPTHNRLELLRYAVYSVMHQNYDDWEIIIFDNASEEDVKGYVDSLDDDRVRYYRTTEFVSVTQNWNNALERATGDYVIMLGDDDGLVQGFFRIVVELIEQYEYPNLIYTDAYVYAYPGVVPGYPDGYLQLGYNTRFKNRRDSFLLTQSEGIEIVREALALRLPILYNMQLSVIQREFINTLADHGPFFQSPFPDYYATVVSLLKSTKTVIYQQPIVIIGISPKSFGYYFFNLKEGEGMPLLNTLPERTASKLQHVVLPGSWEMTCRLMAMETVATNYGAQWGLSVDIGEYRRAQALHNLHALFTYKMIKRRDFFVMTHHLSWVEYYKYIILQGFSEILYKRIKHRILKLLSPALQLQLRRLLHTLRGSHNNPPRRIAGFTTILDVFAEVRPRHSDY